MNRMIIPILLVFIMLPGNLSAQVKLDSLWRVWNDESVHDSSRMQALRKITLDHYMYSKPDSARFYSQILYEYAHERNLKKEMADALNLLGISSYVQSDYSEALNYYQKSLEIKEHMYDRLGMAKTLNNIGMIYTILGEYQKAMEYYQRSLEITKVISNKNIMAYILSNIGKIAKNQGNYPKAIDYYRQSLEINEEISNIIGVANTLNRIGSIYLSQGLYMKALSYYQRSLFINEEISNKRGAASSFNNIGLIYLRRNDYSNALNYFQKSLKIKEEMTDKNGMAISLNNIGLVYMKQGDYSEALGMYEQSLEIRKEISDKKGIAGTLNNIGEAYLTMNKNEIAKEYFQRSLDLHKEISDNSQIAANLINLGFVSNNQGRHSQAIIWCEEALKISDKIKILEEQKNACKCLYNAYKSLADNKKALAYHEHITVLDDSLQAKETTKRLQQLEFKRQIREDSLVRDKEKLIVQIAHEKEVQKKKRTRNIYLITASLFLLLGIGFYRRIVFERRAKKAIEIEKKRSDKLLLNILPGEIADELKEKGSADARNFEMVSILFTDFKGFTKISEKYSAEILVREINTCFKAFDAMSKKYGIEKIKTIGDSYMAAGGLPVATEYSVKDTVMAGIEMAEFINKRKLKHKALGKIYFEMRLGIHTGSVVAGIVGEIKFQYDIWGDTVNIASCMENSGVVEKVNISQATYDQIKDEPGFRFQSRGKVKSKDKGELEMWFVEKAT